MRSTPSPSRALSCREGEAEVWTHFSHRSGDAGFLHGSGNKVIFPENLGSLENTGAQPIGGALGSH